MISWHRLSRSSTFVWSFWAQGWCLCKRWLELRALRTCLRRLKSAIERPIRPPLHSHETAIDGIWMALDGIFCRYPKFFDGVSKIYRVRNIDRWQKNFAIENIASIVRFSFCRPVDRMTSQKVTKINIFFVTVWEMNKQLWFVLLILHHDHRNPPISIKNHIILYDCCGHDNPKRKLM